MNSMKAIFILAGATLFVGCASFNARQPASIQTKEETFKDAEKRLNDYCNMGHGNQPGWPDLLQGIDILSTDAKVSACNLHKKMGLASKHGLYMQGFRKVDKGNEFTYYLIDFSKPKPDQQTCVATSHYVHQPNTSWDAREEIFDIVCKPLVD